MPAPTCKPLIGVTGPRRKRHFLWFCNWLGVRLGGGRAVRLAPGAPPERRARCAGFIISGGSDIHPGQYGEQPIAPEHTYDPARDALEREIVAHAIAEHAPLLAICRGMQMLNVTRGGTLHQEAKDVLEDFLPNESLLSKLIGRREVAVYAPSHLHELLGAYDCYWVNSIHHQAVNRLGEGLHIVAREKNDVVQAIEGIDRTQHPFLIGVQWHPELMLHAPSARRLFRALVEAARQAGR